MDTFDFSSVSLSFFDPLVLDGVFLFFPLSVSSFSFSVSSFSVMVVPVVAVLYKERIGNVTEHQPLEYRLEMVCLMNRINERTNENLIHFFTNR
mgnify:CR=1 FL=1